MLELLRYEVPLRQRRSLDTVDDEVDDFNLTVIDEVRKVAKKSQYTNDEIKKVNELATIFLDTRKVLKSDHNVVDPIKEDKDHFQHKSMLRGSIVRAEKVKAMMAIKYMYLQRQYDWFTERGQEPSRSEDNVESDQRMISEPSSDQGMLSRSDEDRIMFSEPSDQRISSRSDQRVSPPSERNFDGMYNPIQIIRNRKIRMKYHEYPKPMNIKTLPLACNVFSKHSKTKKNYKMVWSIELNELLQDRLWRQDHLHELTNSKGELWFPQEKKRRRLREKIDKVKPDSANRDSVVTSSSDPLKKRHKIRKKVKRKLYSSNSSSIVDLDTASVGERSSKSVKSGKSTKNSDFDATSIYSKHFKPTVEHQDIDTGTLVDGAIPEIKIENVQDVPIKSISKTPQTTPELSEDEGCNQAKCKSILAGQDLELNTIFKHYSYISQTFKLKRNYLVGIYPKYTQKVNDKLDEIIDTQVQEIMSSTVRINDYYLQIFESLFTSFSEEILAVVHLTNDDHSVKIDNLLSTSDRSIGEINTSLTSEVRKIDERIDRLRGSFVDSCVMQRCNDSSDYKMRLNENNYKTLYYVLESMIVITLRMVWVIVNIYKAIVSVLRFLWKIIKICLF